MLLQETKAQPPEPLTVFNHCFIGWFPYKERILLAGFPVGRENIVSLPNSMNGHMGTAAAAGAG